MYSAFIAIIWICIAANTFAIIGEACRGNIRDAGIHFLGAACGLLVIMS